MAIPQSELRKIRASLRPVNAWFEAERALAVALAADLANVPVLAKLTRGERLALRERLGSPEHPASEAALAEFHRWVQQTVIPLVDTEGLPEGIPAEPFFKAVGGAQGPYRVAVDKSGHVLFFSHPYQDTGFWRYGEIDRKKALQDIFVPGQKFPFSRCKTCGLVYVPKKRPSRFHSRQCALDAKRERVRQQNREAATRWRAKKKSAEAGGA